MRSRFHRWPQLLDICVRSWFPDRHGPWSKPVSQEWIQQMSAGNTGWKKWEKFSALAHKPDDRTKENMNQHACPKIIIWQHKVFNQFRIHHRLKSGMLKDICAGAKYISNLRQEFTGMLRDTFHLLLECRTEWIIY